LKIIYIFSGLGADERVFNNCTFHSYTPCFIPWQKPFKKETITEYATRLRLKIKEPNPTLLGISFGGIIAIEIAKQIHVEKLYLISSVETKLEIPFVYRLAGKFKLHKLIPYQLFKLPNPITYWAFGVKSNQDRLILKQIILETDVQFLKWAIQEIITWKNEEKFPFTITIHGGKDRLLPPVKKNYQLLIPDGGHLMILSNALEVSRHICLKKN
jgi:pimeloyl-ACP methyl ester carboxylesterase